LYVNDLRAVSTAACKLLTALATACLLASEARAARPFVTDDARIVDQGHCQLETFYKKQHAYSGSEFWFLPACNPSFVPLENGLEITVGGNRIEDERNLIVQGKKLLKPLQPNGAGFAVSVGTFGSEPYVNGIGSFSFLDDRAVIHSNLGYLENRPTWGLGLEALLWAPRVYAILETFGERGEKPTQHVGIRFWVIPNRFQIDTTYGQQASDPVRRFHSFGLRFIY